MNIKTNNENTSNKSELRKRIRKKRQELSPGDQEAAACDLLEKLKTIPDFLNASKLAMYLCNDGEIDPQAVMRWCWKNLRKTYVPVVVTDRPNSLMFAEVDNQTEFVKNRFGINEPLVALESMMDAQSLDLVLMPLVAFDQEGNRLGMGGGFYDRTFDFLKTGNIDRSSDQSKIIGIAHELQKVEKVDAEQWDIPLSIVVTDKNIYQFVES